MKFFTSYFRQASFILSLLVFILHGISQTVIPHSVPEEFNSDYYEVKVNGQSVPVFHAGLNRRFTHVWLYKHKFWSIIARQATIIKVE